LGAAVILRQGTTRRRPECAVLTGDRSSAVSWSVKDLPTKQFDQPLLPARHTPPCENPFMTLVNTQYAEAIAKVGGYYNFVTIINRRLKELNNGQPPMVMPPADKNYDKIDLIVKEIEAGLLIMKA